MSHRYCIVQDEGRVRIVTLNRPEVLNALHADANDELAAVWDEFAARDDLWVGIITGAGERAFSAGNDLKVQAEGRRRPNGPNGFAGITQRFNLDKPLIAAVNGWAMGGGFETALACDIIIAAENALFALPEPRVGLIAGGGGVHRLPRVIPMKKAMGMILTGRRVAAREGFRTRLRHRAGSAGPGTGGREALGRHDPGMLAQGGARFEAGLLSWPGRAVARARDAHGLSGAAGEPGERGLHRRPTCLRGKAQAELAEPIGRGTMRIYNLYCDANGELHWRDIEVEWVEERNFSKISARLPANGIIFRETSGDYDLSWHPAPRRQYIINLDGGVQITASDGQARTIGAGEVVLVEDITGKGHLSKSVGGKMRRSIFVPVE